MNLDLDPRQKDAQALAKEIAEREIAPRAAEHDRNATFPEAQIKTLGDAGLLAMLPPKDKGGAGYGALAYSLAITEVARACPATSVTMAVTNMVADSVAAFGTEAQIETHVRAIHRGEYTAGSFCLSEPDAGSDAASLRTSAARDGDDYVLSGSKMWITSGDRSNLLLVMAKTDPDARSRGISTFIVQPDMPGFSVGKHEEKMGLRASSTVSIHLDQVRVPESGRLGPEGIGFKIAMRALDGGRIGIGSQAIGIGEAALAAAKGILQRQPELRSSASEARFAVLHTRLEAARMLVLRAAWLKDAGQPFTREASMAKLYATETANQVCAEALELAGPEAYGSESSLERLFRDVRVTTIYEGTSEIQRLVIARDLLAAA